MNVPVTADEIIQASKNLKDSVPGLDGMKKCDFNKIAPEDSGCSVGVPQICSKRKCYMYSTKKKKEHSIPAISVRSQLDQSLADYSTAC